MGAKKRHEIRPIAAYASIGYECLRCHVCFMSADGPQPFCPTCRATLDKAPKRRAAKGRKA